MNLTVLAVDFGSFYGAVGTAQTRAILAATVVATILALLSGAVKHVTKRIRSRHS